ncbi:MAG: Fe2+-dependent dioxygenase [Pseudomonadota bacterium]
MLLTISNVLDQTDLEAVRTLIDTLAWRDGKETAGSAAKAVKQNKQADLSSRTGLELRKTLSAAIQAHPVLVAAAQPKHFSKLLISKTEAAGGYGWHIDNAFLGKGTAALRTDLSFTLFLSKPTDYEGGELMIEHAGMTQGLKAKAGDLVLYPASSVHQVAQVISGERLACVGWIESRIQRPDDRELLFDLTNLRADLSRAFDAQSPQLLMLNKVIANMLRRLS